MSGVALSAAAPWAMGLLPIGERYAADGVAFDKFGWGLALSGDTAVATATGDDDWGAKSGAAYVFERWTQGANPWREVVKLVPSDGAAGDEFGFAAGISGDWAVITARADDDNGTDAGSAYLFRRDAGGPGAWGAVKKLFAADAAAGDLFGWSAAIDGDTLVIGSLMGSSTTGAAYLFDRNQGGPDAWGFVKKITSADVGALDRFGRSVSISGDTLVVTADGDDDVGSSSGSAYVFERNAGGASNWGEVKKLTASDASAVDHFGIAGAISDDTVVIGAHRDDDGGTESGSAYLFGRHEGGSENWGEVVKLTALDPATADSFGRAVAIRGDVVAVGAYAHNHAGLGVRSGAVYLFERDNGGAEAWGQTQELNDPAGVAEDVFGWSIALGQLDALVGVPHLDEAVGEAPGSLLVFGPWPAKTRKYTGAPSMGLPISAPARPRASTTGF